MAQTAVDGRVQRLETLVREQLADRALQGRAGRLEADKRVGQLLLSAKAALGHGAYLPWLESLGLARSSAHRFVQAYSGQR